MNKKEEALSYDTIHKYPLNKKIICLFCEAGFPKKLINSPSNFLLKQDLFRKISGIINKKDERTIVKVI